MESDAKAILAYVKKQTDAIVYTKEGIYYAGFNVDNNYFMYGLLWHLYFLFYELFRIQESFYTVKTTKSF